MKIQPMKIAVERCAGKEMVVANFYLDFMCNDAQRMDADEEIWQKHKSA